MKKRKPYLQYISDSVACFGLSGAAARINSPEGWKQTARIFLEWTIGHVIILFSDKGGAAEEELFEFDHFQTSNFEPLATAK